MSKVVQLENKNSYDTAAEEIQSQDEDDEDMSAIFPSNSRLSVLCLRSVR